MQVVTKCLEDNLKQVMQEFHALQYASKDIYDSYWDTDANTQVAAASAGAQVLVSPQVKKEDYQNAITLADNVYKFFNNTAVSATDHMQYSNLVIYGTDYATPISAELSPATAEIGANIVKLATNCMSLLERARSNQNLYFDNEVGDIVSVLDGERIIPGSVVTRNDLNNAITLLQQFENFMTDQTIVTGDYSVTVSKWLLY